MKLSLVNGIRLHLINRLRSGTVLNRVAGNTAWLIVDRIGRLIIAFVVSLWVARYLGPDNFGLLNYATALVGLFVPFAQLGLSSIVVRDVMRSPDEQYVVLGTAFAMQFFGGLLMLLFSIGAVLLLNANNSDLQLLVLIVAVARLFTAFQVIDDWYQSQLKSKYSVIAKSGALFFVPALKIGLILNQAPLWAFAATVFAEMLLGAIGLGITYGFTEGAFKQWRFRIDKATQLLNDSWPLLFSAIAIIIYMKIDQVLLQVMVGERELGLYSAAVRISEIWYFVPVTIMSSLFPVIIAAKERGPEQYYKILRWTFRLMAGLSVSVAVIVSFTGAWIIPLLFGQEYAEASKILSVHVWAGVPVAMGAATSPWVVTEGVTTVTLHRTIFGALVNVALNLWLIPIYGGLGAAIATLIAYICAAIAWHLIDKRTRHIGIMQIKAFIFQ